MENESQILAILTEESQRTMASQLATMLGYGHAHVVVGDGHVAAAYLQQHQLSPRYILFLVGDRKQTVESELAALSVHCEAGTKVIVVGITNDIHFYRMLMDQGVLDYMTPPIEVARIAQAFGKQDAIDAQKNGHVLAFTSAGAGDGASTIAANAAFALADKHNARTILVDMDYQFGMVAKNLDLSSPFGLKELFDHPDRAIDATLVERMAVSYRGKLDVIGAPSGLHFYPTIPPELIRELILALKSRYDYIVLDLPHLWSPWISAAFNQCDALFLVAQLWLKSVTHASRQLAAWRETGMDLRNIHVCINRSGAKFKEGVTAKDFERVCMKEIHAHFPNDIRTAAAAEQEGKTILELRASRLSEEVERLAEFIKGRLPVGMSPPAAM